LFKVVSEPFHSYERIKARVQAISLNTFSEFVPHLNFSDSFNKAKSDKENVQLPSFKGNYVIRNRGCLG